MKVAVITGSNRGIGLALTKCLSEKEYKVYALCRKSSEELQNISNINIIENINVTEEKSLTPIIEEFSNTPIDLVINNAGILRDESLDNFNFETIQEQFEVNTLGPLKITLQLLPFLKSESKIAMITSRMGSIADNSSGRKYGYRMSKTALNMASSSLAFDLKDKSIAVGIIHPGYVRTDMTAQTGQINTTESAQNIMQRIDELNIENSGTFWHSNGEILPW